IDKGVRIPPETHIGFDPMADAERGFTITDSGLVVIGRGENLELDLHQSSAGTVA
ncbi:MAG: glucose-1-phosphate adenylyltransferase, partial [Planctomycetota bacterium]